MPGNRAENVLEIRAYIKRRSLLFGLKTTVIKYNKKSIDVCHEH